ncbi:MAG: hypothetical protein ACLSG9_11655 [Eubacterium sp.]
MRNMMSILGPAAPYHGTEAWRQPVRSDARCIWAIFTLISVEPGRTSGHLPFRAGMDSKGLPIGLQLIGRLFQREAYYPGGLRIRMQQRPGSLRRQ